MTADATRDAIKVAPRGKLWQLSYKTRRWRCAIGRSGVRRHKKEGDGATPAGCWPLRSVLFRPDRVSPPQTRLAVAPLGPSDGWCDDPADPGYNTAVHLPYGGRHESLWRDDPIYDVVVVVGYNDDPPQPGRGSAIFLHVARAGFAPTEGCIALPLADLLELLDAVAPDTRLCIHDS